MDSCEGIEKLLSLLKDMPHLALVITLRGEERPAQVRWTRPFLAPLKLLTLEDACHTFFDIAEDIHDSNEVDRLLSFTDNMPLAIDLMAHLVDYEGVLSRWEVLWPEIKSGAINPTVWITSSPDAQDLLNLLAIPPDGILELELLQSKLPIENLLGWKATLLRASLATIDVRGRLKKRGT
ncbi:hypothetical protein DFH07DRAFT_776565 [Mycena maculata]|uniref:Uncharacterized protein n=1 Tax=Mycena maculata TaxID=230809 RepID=A0AAD7INC3_9AGAR|nr:hypothetical protein DFH07DRAFT_776565 [Mycena maculata]